MCCMAPVQLMPQQLQPYVVQQPASPTRSPAQQEGQELASLGAEGHANGQCIPCLMQVRWRAGRCKEPCRFGNLCGRCHEPHTEEELQRVQARMRKEKKKNGAVGAALLSAAYATGRAAPIGAGATRAHP
eukprot:SRR837773.12710.p3 GENE.SRR837773.12710~~SRR837773.12710.p3  ORF type:complete len:145 (-),score=45.02 SRR837773.12710:32-421(-)